MNKKVKTAIIVVATIIIALCVYWSVTAKSEYTVGNIYLEEFSFEKMKSDNNDVVKSNLKSDYYISEKQAKIVSNNRSDYATLYIKYSVYNNSPFPIYVIKPAFPDWNSNVFLSKEAPEAQGDRYIKPKCSITFSTFLIIKKDAVQAFLQGKYHFKVLCIGYTGFGLINASFSGNTEFETNYTMNLYMENEVSDEKLRFFIPDANEVSSCTVDDYDDCINSLVRICDHGYYGIVSFEDAGIKRYGVSLFDANGKFKSGMLFSDLLNPGTDFHIITGITTFENIKKIDRGSILFSTGNKDVFKSYHYFTDETYAEITYHRRGKNYIVTGFENHLKNDILNNISKEDLTKLKTK